MSMESNSNEAILEAQSIKNAVSASTAEKVQAAYSLYAEKYDQKSTDLGFWGHREAALVCLNHIKNCKASAILDVAAGIIVGPSVLGLYWCIKLSIYFLGLLRLAVK